MITLLKSLLRLDFLWMMIMALNLMVEKPSNLRACKTLRNDGDYKLAYVRMLLCEHERIGGVWLGVCISNLTMIFTVFLLRSHYLLKSLYDHWKFISMHLKKNKKTNRIITLSLKIRIMPEHIRLDLYKQIRRKSSKIYNMIRMK